MSTTSKSRIAEENKRKVLQRRAEARYMKEMAGGGGLNLSKLDKHRDEVHSEDRTVPERVVPKRTLVTKQVDRDPFRPVQEVTGEMRLFELTQGGATLWTAENDGSITIRSGGNGLVVHTFPATGGSSAAAPAAAEGEEAQPQEEEQEEEEGGDAPLVTAMKSTATHMWVGFNNGNVKVYDHLVFLHITEGVFHTAPVTGFCECHDGRMYSCAEDGVIVKWDTEENVFEAMSKIVSGQSSIVSVASFGYQLFSASKDGDIVVLDTESSEARGTIQCDQGKGDVVAMAVTDWLLFVAADDTIQVFAIDAAGNNELVKVNQCVAKIKSLSLDAERHRLWAGLDDGTIEVWRTVLEDDFTLEKTITDQQGHSIVALRTYAAIDSLKLWSLSSNGVNKVWYSSVNKIEIAMNETIDALKAVVRQDTIELDQWRALVHRLQMINNRRKMQLARSLQKYHEDLMRRRYVYKWREVMRQQLLQRRRVAISNRLASEIKMSFGRCFFLKWFRWYRASQNLRLKTKYSDLLMSTSRKSAVVLYFRKLQTFVRRTKAAIRKRELVSILGAKNNEFDSRVFFRKWLKYLHQAKQRTAKLRHAESLMLGSETTRRRLYFCKWMDVSRNAMLRGRKQKFGELMMSLHSKTLRQQSFKRLYDNMDYKRRLKRKGRLASVLLVNTDRGLQSMYWAKFLLLRARQQKRKLEVERTEAEQNLAHLREKYSALDEIINRKKELDVVRGDIHSEQDALEQRQLKLEQLHAKRDEMLRALAAKDLENMRRSENAQEQMDNLMSRLKAKVINFHADYALISQQREKVKQTNVGKLFLEAHQNVKRVVVEVTKKPHMLPDEEWPLTDDLLRKMPAHQLNVLLQSIKTMILSFDSMDKATRDGMSTDAEIVLNARWLVLIADMCMEHRRKTLSKSAPQRMVKA